MAYIGDEKELLQKIEGNKEYSELFDNGEFETLIRYMKDDGIEFSKQFFNGVLLDLGISLNDGITRASEMKYTIVGTEGAKKEYGNLTGDREKHGGVHDPNIKPTMKYLYRYAGLNNKGQPTTLVMNYDAYSHRVYFKDIQSAEDFLEKFVEFPRIKNRKNQVQWKVIPISKRTPIGATNRKAIEMKEVDSPAGKCFQIA